MVSRILGYTPRDLEGRHFTELVVAEDRDGMSAVLDEVRTEREVREGIANEQLRRDGEAVSLRTSCIPRLTPGGAFLGYLGTHRDVTREMALERELRHSQTMEAVGLLAGGIAHDFNNLLTGILGSCHLVLDELREDDAVYEDVCQIKEAGERASSLTRQLLAIGRKQILFLKRLNLNAVILGMEELLRVTLGEDVELVIRTADNLPDVRADGDQLQQVMLQLAVNAREAMVDLPPFYQPELWATSRDHPTRRRKRFELETALVRREEGKHAGGTLPTG
ncbi:MAG: PAS domain S-box protein, partial [Akkermansiaceae bacterium]|nr:PAS domain S-box protein [Akkermansiaceae bacterium]